MERVNNLDKKTSHQNSVHWVLTHGYATHFALFLIGVILDMTFQLKLLSVPFARPVGIFLLVVSTISILWAQTTSRNLDTTTVTKETFCRGPYCYTRNPTHWGLFFLVLGFGIIANAFFVILTTLIAFILSKLVFLRKEEEILAHKYGAPYLEYKKQIKI